MDVVGGQDVVVSHCIIHQENLCTKVLAFVEVMTKVGQCVNYIRARGLNHRQFKAFLEYLDLYISLLYVASVELPLLKRFCNLRQEIKQFMESKHQNVTFLCDELFE